MPSMEPTSSARGVDRGTATCSSFLAFCAGSDAAGPTAAQKNASKHLIVCARAKAGNVRRDCSMLVLLDWILAPRWRQRVVRSPPSPRASLSVPTGLKISQENFHDDRILGGESVRCRDSSSHEGGRVHGHGGGISRDEHPGPGDGSLVSDHGEADDLSIRSELFGPRRSQRAGDLSLRKALTSHRVLARRPRMRHSIDLPYGRARPTRIRCRRARPRGCRDLPYGSRVAVVTGSSTRHLESAGLERELPKGSEGRPRSGHQRFTGARGVPKRDRPDEDRCRRSFARRLYGGRARGRLAELAGYARARGPRPV